MKSEIEAAIRSLENNKPDKSSDPKPNQNSPTKNGPPDKFPWKVIIPVFLVFLLVLAIGIVIFRKKRKQKSI